MELKKGYKQTDIGIIPKDWEVLELGKIINYTKGYAFKPSDYQGDGTRIVRVSDTTYDSIKDENCVYIDAVKANAYGKWKLKENDLVISTVGSKPPMYDSLVGKVIRVEKKHEGSLLNQNAVLIRAKDNKSHKQNLMLSNLRTDRYIRHIEAIYRGNANQASITLYELFNFQLALPKNEEEQRAIAAASSDVDALLTALNALIAKKRDIKQGAMQELLTGKKRLPGFTEKWEVKKIGEMTHTTAGGTPSTLVEAYWGGEIKWMSSGELHLKRVYDVDGCITEEGLKNSSTKIIPPKCVLIGLAGQGKTRGTVAMNMVELCTNQSIAAIFPSNNFIPEYLYFNLDARYEELRSISTGDGGRGGLNLTLINALDVPIPSLHEQQAIASILSDMDAEIAALDQKREKTRLLKEGMMQELLSGKTRLL